MLSGLFPVSLPFYLNINSNHFYEYELIFVYAWQNQKNICDQFDESVWPTIANI